MNAGSGMCTSLHLYVKSDPYLMSQLNMISIEENSQGGHGITLLLFLNRVLNQKIHYSSSLPDSSNRTYLFLRVS